MKAVLDTNVFISGIFWTGEPYETLELWRNKKFVLISSMDILSEFIRVLNDFKIKLPRGTIKEWTKLIINNSMIVEPKEKIKIVKDDPKDDMFIEAAVEGNAEYIVSQDKHLLKINKFESINIITPKEFNKIVESVK